MIQEFPRLAMKSRYLELIWTCEIDHDMPSPFDGIAPLNGGQFRPSLKDRLKSLHELVDYLPDLKDVHIELGQLETYNLKDIVDELIACPNLTSFSIKSAEFFHVQHAVSTRFGSHKRTLSDVPWCYAKEEEDVDFVIWSREHGFLVDNTDEEKAKQEVEAARERRLRGNAAETERGKAFSHESDRPGLSNGICQTAATAPQGRRTYTM